MGKRYRYLLHISCPHTCIDSPTIIIIHKSDIFVTIDKPTLTHHYRPKSLIYMRVHSWCCTFYGFGHIYNEIQPLVCIRVHCRVFSLPCKFSVFYFFTPSLCPSPWQPLIFSLCPWFCLFQNVIELESDSI